MKINGLNDSQKGEGGTDPFPDKMPGKGASANQAKPPQPRCLRGGSPGPHTSRGEIWQESRNPSQRGINLLIGNY